MALSSFLLYAPALAAGLTLPNVKEATAIAVSPVSPVAPHENEAMSMAFAPAEAAKARTQSSCTQNELDQGCVEAPKVHGDPMFKYNDTSRHFWVNPGLLTPLMSWATPEGSRMSLAGVTFGRANTGNQWFNRIVVSLDVDHTVRDVLDVRTKEDGMMNITLDGSQIPLSSQDVHTSATGVKIALSERMDRAESAISKRQLHIEALGFKISVYSAKSAKFASSRENLDAAHLNMDFESAIPQSAKGLFPELAGMQPMSAATSAMLKAPKDLAHKAVALVYEGCICPDGVDEAEKLMDELDYKQKVDLYKMELSGKMDVVENQLKQWYNDGCKPNGCGNLPPPAAGAWASSKVLNASAFSEKVSLAASLSGDQRTADALEEARAEARAAHAEAEQLRQKQNAAQGRFFSPWAFS